MKYANFVKFWKADVRGFWTREKGPQNSTCWWPPESSHEANEIPFGKTMSTRSMRSIQEEEPVLAPLATCNYTLLISLDFVVVPLLVRDTVDWIHIIFKSNSYHDVIWSCWMQAGEVEVSIQGIQSFNIARTQLEGAPAQLCQHQLGSLGTHLTTLGPMSDIRRACMIQTRSVSMST